MIAMKDYLEFAITFCALTIMLCFMVIGISMELIFALTVVVAGLILPYAGMIKVLT